MQEFLGCKNTKAARVDKAEYWKKHSLTAEELQRRVYKEIIEAGGMSVKGQIKGRVPVYTNQMESLKTHGHGVEHTEWSCLSSGE